MDIKLKMALPLTKLVEDQIDLIECIDDLLEIVNFDKMMSFAEHLNENWEFIDNLGPNRNIYARKDRKNDKAICYTTKEIFELWNG